MRKNAFADQLFTGECRFLLSAPKPENLPPPRLPEIAFAGRSNVGKSSLINALVAKKQMARASETPGRTQMINFFLLGEKPPKQLILADLPGYGYAKAPAKQVRDWGRLATAYLLDRPTLRRALVLIDARRGVMDSDQTLLAMLDEAAVSAQLVLTKADKLSAKELTQVQQAVLAAASPHPCVLPDLITTSAEKGDGIVQLRNTLATLVT